MLTHSICESSPIIGVTAVAGAMERINLTVGTAGHIDHGKTSLIKALTGVDTDCLPEEKQRSITIDIGFTKLDLGDLQVGIVDVPGHERFIKNMLAGVAGIDIALLCIAADDSVMPQTREHLAILQLLGIKHGIIALTKTDLVDPEWLELVREDVRSVTKDTFLHDAPIISTSTLVDNGLKELKNSLKETCYKIDPRNIGDLFRLAVDRSFVKPGVGTIVTGTISSGCISVGDTVDCLPSKKTVRIRGLESHGKEYEQLTAGQRAALHLGGLNHKEIKRGHELAYSGYLAPTKILSASLKVLPDCSLQIKHRSRLRLHLGTQEIMVTLHILEGKKIAAGSEQYVQLLCAHPTMAIYGQRFILRAESPLTTVGGGTILQAHTTRISSKKNNITVSLEHLHSPKDLTRAAIAIQHYDSKHWSELDLCRDAGIELKSATKIVEGLRNNGIVHELAGRHMHKDNVAQIQQQILKNIKILHERSPFEDRLPRNRLFGLFDYLETDLLNALIDRLVDDGKLISSGQDICLVGFKPEFSKEQQTLKDHIVESYLQGKYMPPDAAKIAKNMSVSEKDIKIMINICVKEGSIIPIGGGFFIHTLCKQQLIDELIEWFQNNELITLSQFRQLLETTRKYAVPLAEYLDRIGVTTRQEDARVLARVEPSL